MQFPRDRGLRNKECYSPFNSQRGGKKGQDKNKDVMVLDEKRLAEINTTTSSRLDRVKVISKRNKELEFDGDVDDLCVVMQEEMNLIVVNINKEIHTLRAFEDTEDGELQACNAKVEA